MNLCSLDPKLLVLFDVMMQELHVTRAARRVGLTQPAMSNALSRLRHAFGDELLVRAGNRMEPTPRALELHAPVRDICRRIDGLLKSAEAFDPATAERIFTLRMSDLLAALLLPDLVGRLAREAPRLTLDVVNLAPTELVRALELDHIDGAISMGIAHPRAICAEALLSDRFVCVLRRGHPAAEGELSAEGFMALRHIKESVSMTDDRFVDDVLARLGLRRDIALHLPHWLVTPEIVSRSDLALVTTDRLARSFGDERLAVVPLPFDLEPFHWRQYWHRRHDANEAHRWLRGAVRDACRQRDASASGA